MRIGPTVFAVLFALLHPAARAAAAPAVAATTPGELTSYTTLLSAGFEWRIAGDDDGDCTVSLEYRRFGDAAWKPAQPLLRVATGLWTHGEDPGNLLAGSLFFLQPGARYEARLTLADPDGGADQRVLAFTTRTEPLASAQRTRFVTPGSGGGTGTFADPFRGLAAADAAAAPGDLFLLRAGTYAGNFRPTHGGAPGQAVVYRALDPGTAVLDGGGGTDSTSHCVNVSGLTDVFLEGLTIVNALRPVRADDTRGVVIRGCTIQPVAQPTEIRGISAARSRELFVADNTILMPGQWATIGRTGAYGVGGYGILVEGEGHVICRNTIVEAWDAISMPVSEAAVPAVITRNVDVYENLVDRASDDGVQADATHQNIRVFRNRLLNTGSAVSFQPCYGGPAYVLFNEAYNTRIEPWKFHQETFFGWTQETSGMIVWHNTSVCSRQGWNETGVWRNGRFRNNLFLGGRPGVPTLILGYNYVGASLDYDGFNRTSGTTSLVQYQGVNYANLPAFFAARGHEQHGVELPLSALASAPLPHHPEWNPGDGYGAAYGPTDFDLRPIAGGAATDRGQPLANVNDGFAGAAPDLGCYEAGAPVPVYGARVSPPPVSAPPAPAAVALAPPLPNPFATRTTLRFTLATAGAVRLTVHDVRGARIRTLVAEPRGVGLHVAEWDGLDAGGAPVAPGLYFARLAAPGVAATRRLVLAR